MAEWERGEHRKREDAEEIFKDHPPNWQPLGFSWDSNLTAED